MKHERRPITLTMDPPLHLCTCGFRGFAHDVSSHIERERAAELQAESEAARREANGV